MFILSLHKIECYTFNYCFVIYFDICKYSHNTPASTLRRLSLVFAPGWFEISSVTFMILGSGVYHLCEHKDLILVITPAGAEIQICIPHKWRIVRGFWDRFDLRYFDRNRFVFPMNWRNVQIEESYWSDPRILGYEFYLQFVVCLQ